MRTIFISGAGSGIGLAGAEAFLLRGHRVVGLVRDAAALTDLARRFKNQLFIFVCELSRLETIEQLPSFLKDNQIETVDILINNAGMVVAGPFAYQPFEEISQTLHVNVLAVMKLTQTVLPYVISARGRIINISSVSGIGGTPFLSAYCASKHAIEGFSESLRRELNLFGVKVVVIGPGSVKTPIWKKGFERIRERYVGTPFENSFAKFIDFAAAEEKGAISVGEVVACIMSAAFAVRPRIRYAPVPQSFSAWFIKVLPRPWVDQIMTKALGLR